MTTDAERWAAAHTALGFEILRAAIAQDDAEVDRLFAADPREAFESILGHCQALLEVHCGGSTEALEMAASGSLLIEMEATLDRVLAEETA